MPDKSLRFAFFGNEYQAKKSATMQKMVDLLRQHGAQICIDRPYYVFLTKVLHLDIDVTDVFDGDDFTADFAVSMGGDGTLLRTASRIGAKNIPIIGINVGRLGFLADVNPAELEFAVSAIYAGDYKVDAHSVLSIDVDGKELNTVPFAINDVALLKRDTASMISVRASVDGEYLMTYQADGLIVTTPMGSTAYSLSNGGPIIAPGAGILCLTPVAPHSLNVRPIVVTDDSVITLNVESRSHTFLVAVDGRSVSLPEGTLITISKAKHSVKVVRYSGRSYFSTLREKMMWGLDQR
ncbi:MAG: NAD kinase [Prevotella sp.]